MSDVAPVPAEPSEGPSLYEQELARMGFTPGGLGRPPQEPPPQQGQPPSRASPPQALPQYAPLVPPGPLPGGPPAPAPPGPVEESQPWGWQPGGTQPARPSSESLTAEWVLKQQVRPAGGWRRAVFTVTGGSVHPAPSRRDRERQALVDRVRRPVGACRHIAVISLKGGVGKTTTTAALGASLAAHRGDRVVAIDANPDRGTLAEKVPRQTHRTVRDLISAAPALGSYADVRAFTSQGPSRLEVLASDADPGLSLAFSENDYRTALWALDRFYNLVLTDCGTGLLHSAMRGVLTCAHQLVVVSSTSLDGARSASATLDWLEAHGYGQLARESVAVVASVRQGSSDVDVARLVEHFGARCRAVELVPYDRHLAAGSVVDLDALAPRTRLAYLRLAAALADGFGPQL